MKTKLLASLLIVMALVCTFVLCAGAATEINSPEQIKELMDETGIFSKTGEYILTQDIDMSGVEGQTPIGTSGNKFSGKFDGDGHTISGINISESTDASYPYVGLFGLCQGATIENLTVDGNVTAQSNDAKEVYAGGLVAWARGITINNCYSYITVVNNDAGACAGGIVGYLDYNGTNIETSITDSANYGSVTAAQYTGGILGLVQAVDKANQKLTITGCDNYGNITITTGNCVGGIVGYYRCGSSTTTGSEFILSDCSNYGTVENKGTASQKGGFTGGVIGAVLASGTDGTANVSITLTNLYNAGTVKRAISASIGAIVGYLTLPKVENGTVDIAMGNWVNVNSAPGWLIYSIGNAKTPVALTMTNMVSNTSTKVFSTENDLSADVTINTNNTVSIDGYITSKSTAAEKKAFVKANSSEYFIDNGEVTFLSELTLDTEIGSPEELALLMQVRNDAETLGKSYKLLCDIDMSGYDQQTIGTSGTNNRFTGSFDGQNFTISGIDISNNAMGTGLFGTVENATIKNLNVEGTVSGTGGSGSRVGGLIGAATGSLTVTNCNVDVVINASSGAAGGIVGTYDSSTRKGTVSITKCTFTGEISSTKYNGGIIGYVTGKNASPITVSECKNEGSITSSSADGTGGIIGLIVPSTDVTYKVENCENEGTVTGVQYIGGIVGEVYSTASSTTTGDNIKLVITGCVNSGDVATTTGNVAGGILGYYNNVKSAGTNTIEITECENTGAVSAKEGAGTCVGGIVGAIGSSSANSCTIDTVTVSNVANTGTVSGAATSTGSIAGILRAANETEYIFSDIYAAGNTYVVGESGKNTDTTIPTTFSFTRIYNLEGTRLVSNNQSTSTYITQSNCYHVGSMGQTSITSYYDLTANSDAWVMTYDGPKLASALGDSVAVDYSIDSAEDLINLMNAPYAWGGGTFTLTKSINISGMEQSPIGTGGNFKFMADFDGQGYTISGVDIEYGQGAGLFGTVQYGSIKNLTVKGDVHSTSSRAGGLVGAVRPPFVIDNVTTEVNVSSVGGASGGIVGVYVGYEEDTLTISNCTSNSTVNGSKDYNGGIVGYVVAGAQKPMTLVIDGCTNNGTVTGTGVGNGGILGTVIAPNGSEISVTDSKNTGAVTGASYNAGIFGYAVDNGDYGTANNVTYSVDGCENTGAITSTSGNGTGGITGLLTLYSNSDVTVSDCVNRGKISGPAYNGGVVAYISNPSNDVEVNGVSYTVTGCKNYGEVETVSGNVAGGILGFYNNAAPCTEKHTLVVEKSANYGEITVNGGEGTFVGGVVGAIGMSNGTLNVDVTLSELYNASSDLYASDYRGGVIGALRTLALGSYTISDICSDGTTYGLISTIGSTSAESGEYKINRAYNALGTHIVSDHAGNTIGGTNNCTAESPASYLVNLSETSKWVMTVGGPKLKIFTDAADVIDTSKPYMISSAADLITVMNNSALWSLDFVLENDINLTGKAQSPIGNSARKFTGTFDGKNNTVSGLDIDYGQNAGLFGVAQGSKDDHCIIKDLTVSGNVDSTSSHAAGIVGTVAGGGVEIIGCTSSVDVTAAAGVIGGIVGMINVVDYGEFILPDTLIENCVNTGSLTGTRYNGGILGYISCAIAGADVTVTGCTNFGDVTNTSSNCAGGIVGYCHLSGTATTTTDSTYLEITHCGNYGAITAPASGQFVGGIIGALPSHLVGEFVLDAVITDVYNAGTLTGKANSIGSIVGLLNTLAGGSYTFANLADEGESNVPMIGDIGSAVEGCNSTYTIINAYTVNGSITPAALDGNVFENTLALTASASAAEKAALASEAGWVITKDGPMLLEFTTSDDFEVDLSIDSVEDYLMLLNVPDAWDEDITLEVNLDLGNVVTKPLGNSDVAFTGTFDGKGHTISGLNIQGTEAGTGFFGVVSDDGDVTVIKNLTIEGTVNCDEYRFVGGFIGIVCGETVLEGLTNKATVTSGYFGANAGRIGGIVGGFVNNNLVTSINDVDNDGDYGLTVKNCENYGKVEAKLNTEFLYSDDYNTTPTVFVRHSQARVGGIIGSITPAYETAKNKGSNTIVIENCQNYGEVTGVVAVGGIAGVAESSKATNSIKITKCSNFGSVKSVYAGGSDIWFGTWTGGIVGYANISGYEAQYVDSFEVSYCYNEGEISAPNAYLIDSKLAQVFYDEDDIVTDGEGVEDGSVDDTTTSSVEYRAQIGGIVGYAYGGYEGHVVTIQSCYNNGLVWANGNDVAGIVGIANSAHVYDCYNTGRVESTYIDTKAETRTYGRYVGGIIGRLAGDLNKFERNFSKGETVSTGGSGYFGVGGGYNAYPHFYTNNFYYNGLTTKDKNSTKVTAAQISDFSVFTGFAESGEWLSTLYGPELIYFHECANTEKVITTEGNCVTNEIYDEACRCLETVYKVGVVGEKNPDNHAFEESAWAQVENASTYEFKCKDCGTVVVTAEVPYVYVDAFTHINAFVGDDENDGVTPETAVYSLEEAVRRLAVTGGKVIICDRYYLGKDGVTEINLPAYENTITITTKLGENDKVVTGFATVLNGVHVNLGGPTKFENIIFNGSADTKNSSDNGYYKIPVICAGWNDVEFGEGIFSFGAAYFVAGNCYHDQFKLATEMNDAAKTQNLVFAKVTALDINDANGNKLQSAVTFFNRVYLGDRVRDGALADGITSYTVANKTVNATFNRTTVIDLYAATAISPEDINAQMQNVDTTINLNLDAYVRYLHTGDGNTDVNGNGTAYMDKLTVNVGGNARVYGAWAFENIRDLTLNISAEEDGRENSYSIPVRPIVTKSKGYIALGTEKATVTYGSHSFNTGVAPAYNAMYAVTETVKDDCDWSEAVLDVVEGVYKQTCSYCGAVKTTVAESATEFEEGTYKYGMSATLANEILPEYLVQISNELTVTDAYLKVEHYADGATEPTVQVVKPYKAVAGSDATTYRFYAPGVAAKEMNDTVMVTFYAIVNGERYVAPTVEKTIVDYYNMAYKAYGNETRGQAPALMATLYSLFNYGAEAQRYFDYNADAPVNAVLPADKVVTEFTAEASAEVEVASDCANDVYTVSGFTPILEDRVVLALAYTLEGEALDSVTFKGSYTDINGAYRTFDVSGANVIVTTNSVVVYVDVIAAKDIRQMITGALYSGDTQVSDSVSFSFECYATIADEAEENICAAILNYCDAAKALFYKEPAKAE